MSFIIQLLIISVVAFMAQTAPLDCESVRSDVLAKAKNRPQLHNQAVHLYCVAMSLHDTVYINNLEQIDELFKNNPLLRILFTVRDWRDCAMSKFYRGQPGQDNHIIADDATVNGCLEDLKWMETIHDYLIEKYFRNTLTVKMEDIILDFDRTIESICGFCALPFERENMISFTERYRNDFKSNRYKDIDKSQVKLYKRIDTVYEGFFKEDKNKKDINEVFDKIEPLLLKYGYESDYTI